MTVLYITYTNLEDVSSGSGLRPTCMYQAFLDRGYRVQLLSGSCGRKDKPLRQAAVRETMTWLQTNRPDFCYIESPTYPIMFNCDYSLIRQLHKRKIPTAYFVRDCYRKFPELFPRRKGFVNTLKEWYLDLLQWRTDRILRLVDLVYFPNERAFRYFSYRNMKTLPPAGGRCVQTHSENKRTCIYVGGLSDLYGVGLLVDTFRILNHDSEQYRLILVCREVDFIKEKHRFGDVLPAWLEVHHVSGKDLAPLYAKADIGLLTVQPNVYTHMAIGTKLFQYLTYGLPVLCSDVSAMKQLIEENHLGLTASYEPEAFAHAVRYMLEDDARLAQYRRQAVENLEANHLWVHRVDQIAKDILNF